MKNTSRFFVSSLLIFSFFASVLPCGPSYVTPVFDYKYAPENPYENFAAGKIGIVKPSYHRSVLFAAYRYLNGGSFSAEEQKALVEVWNADFNNKDFRTDDVSEAVREWTKQRKSVIEKEEKTPDIYVEREYGGYDFFPNCTKNAFETATQTLKDRAASHGSSDKDVKEWVAAQDKVFANCASGKQIPEAPNAAMPEWLQKDRAYQTAAAHFYALDYGRARELFAEIAQDTNSPWQETADYLVGRTMLRQASLSKDKQKANQIYAEAEDYLYRLSVSGNKYAASAEKLLGMVKYRIRPEQRVRELAQTLSYQGGGEDFRQNLIDYTWLMDKFEADALEKEEKRKEALKPKDANANTDVGNTEDNTSDPTGDPNSSKNGVNLEIYLYSDDYSQNWNISVKPEATDEEAIAEAERVTGASLTKDMRERFLDSKKIAYSNRYTENRQGEYQGGYYGEEETSLSILPESLRSDELTEWLFAYQIKDAEAYLYSLDKFKRGGSDLWLATAISKAETSSTDLKRLLDAADKTSRFSPAFPTIAFHQARLLLDLKRPAEAKKLLDEVIGSSIEMPLSSKNQFLELRVGLAETMDDFLRSSLKKPFAFNFGGRGMSVDEIIAEQKGWYNPKYDTKPKDEYDREVEENFAPEKRLQDSYMLDDRAILNINDHFPLEVLVQAAKSPALPEYLQERFLLTAFVRALLLHNHAAAQKAAPEILKLKPELAANVNQFLNAKPNEKQFAALYLILKDENLSPYLAGGFGRPDEQYTYASRWWCAPYDEVYDEEVGDSVPRKVSPKPAFLTPAQSRAAQTEMKRLKEMGDAPKFLAEQVFAWSKAAPRDKRVPESLFIIYEANEWDKYGCGGIQELRRQAAQILKTRYPTTEWAQKVEVEAEQ